MRLRRKKRDEEPENLDRWLLTYADMITLLMAFFIMMYSMSVLNLSKFRDVAFSIRSGFGGIMDSRGRGPVGANGSSNEKTGPIEEVAGVPWQVVKPLVTHIQDRFKDGSVQIGEDERGIVVSIKNDGLMFQPGKADVNPAAYDLLQRVGAVLRQTNNRVQIEGHTCDLPPRGSAYATNWELSTARATNVLRYLVEQENLSPTRFSASGYGSVRPVKPNDCESNRAANRRVEIVILRPDVIPGAVPKNQARVLSDPAETAIRRRLD